MIWQEVFSFVIQGRRRVFKSGPAEEAIVAEGTRGGSTRGGLFPLLLGGFGGLPR